MLFPLTHGYAAVACGQPHFAEGRMIKGIRYINTGCWTKSGSAAVVIVDDDVITLKHIVA